MARPSLTSSSLSMNANTLDSSLSRLFCLSTVLFQLVLSFSLTAPPVSASVIPQVQVDTPSPTSSSIRIRRNGDNIPHWSWTRRMNLNHTSLESQPQPLLVESSTSKRCISVSIDEDGDESWDGDGNGSLIALLSLPCVEICVEGRYVWGRCEYKDFQISEGYGGNALAEASALVVDPFDGIYLPSVPFEFFDALDVISKMALDAEVELFGPALDEVDWESEAGRALLVGFVKNRLLYSTARLQALRIKMAVHGALGLVDWVQEADYNQTLTDWEWIVGEDEKNQGLKSAGAQFIEMSFGKNSTTTSSSSS